jgi:hypothetical protein
MKRLRPERRLIRRASYATRSCSGLPADRRPDYSFEITVAAQWRNFTSLPRSTVEMHCIPRALTRKVDNASENRNKRSKVVQLPLIYARKDNKSGLFYR